MQRNVIKKKSAEPETSRVYKSNIHRGQLPLGCKLIPEFVHTMWIPKWADSRTPWPSGSSLPEAVAIAPLNTKLRSRQDARLKKKKKTGQEKEGMVVLKNGDTLEQVHFMLVLLCNKKSPTHTHLLKRKQEMFSRL